MAGRATYTEQDKARVFVVLTANDGNVKRTSRETGVPENTVRRWRNEFEKNGPPSTEAVEQAATDFITEADETRFIALRRIRACVEDPNSNVKLNELNNTVGILTDKIDRARGLDTKRVDHHHHLPSPDEARELLVGFAQTMKELSAKNTEEIVDAEIVEQPALPKGQ